MLFIDERVPVIQSSPYHFNSLSGSQVFVIDDDYEVRRSLSALLSAASLSYRCYEKASDFLDQYQDTGPSCIVTDVRMPEMSGLQMLERMRDHGIHHPVIVTTGFSEVETVIRAFRDGAIDVFEKPISGTLLLERIHSAIEKDQIEREQRARAREIRLKMTGLSKRELQVMGMLIAGQSNKEIAWQLKLSDKTVAAHRAKLLCKLEFDSLTEMVTDLTRLNLTAEVTKEAA